MPTESNAMTEVALALAMAFFTLLVLALVSMGVPAVEGKSAADRPAPLVSAIALGSREGARPIDQHETLYLYYQARFFDEQLHIVAAADMGQHQKILLAVPESLPLVEMLGIQREISSPNLSITILDSEWIAALEAR